jgi:hypothetical protein
MQHQPNSDGIEPAVNDKTCSHPDEWRLAVRAVPVVVAEPSAEAKGWVIGINPPR